MTDVCETKTAQLLSSGALAKRLGIQRYRLLYLLDVGQIPEPAQRLGGHRVFEEEEVRRIEEILKGPQV